MSDEIRKVTTATDLEATFAVRREVFIKEQAVPEEIELDALDRDPATVHFVAINEAGRPVGAARIRPYGDGAVKIERVAVVRERRGTGLGTRLMEEVEAEARNLGFVTAKLNAQTHARGFYERLGYQPKGEIFMEAGIEHIAMSKAL